MNTLSILLSVLLIMASPAFATDAPQLQEGDRWEFKATSKEGITSTTDTLDGNYELVFLNGRLDVFYISGGQKTQATAGNAEDLKRLIPFKQDQLQFLNFPLSAGKKWTTEYNHVSPGARKPHRRWAEFQIEKLERIKVSAGEFQALKIKGTGQSFGREGFREWDYYYCPDAKSIIKYYYDSGVGTKSGKTDIELVKFTPGGK